MVACRAPSDIDLPPRYEVLMRNLSHHARYYTTKPTIPSPQLSKRQKYPELSNLPPLAPGTVKHVSIKRTEPASASQMVFRTPAPGGVLNPEYNLMRGNNRYAQCPSANNSIFNARIIPHDLLSHVEPGQLPPFPPSRPSQFAKFGPEGEKIRYRSKMNKQSVVYASLLIITSKAKVHNHAVIRRTTARRIREALRLIVIRGACASNDGKSVVFDTDDAGEDKWLVEGWSYVLFPTLEAYRVPWPSLVTTVRESLTKLKAGVGYLSGKAVSKQASNLRNTRSTSEGNRAPSRESSTLPLANGRPTSEWSGRGTGNNPTQNRHNSKPPSTRPYSTRVNRRGGTPPVRKVDMRAEVILGMHNKPPYWKYDDLQQPEMHEVHRPVAHPWLKDWEFEPTQSSLEYHAQILPNETSLERFYAETYEDDAEGWVVAGNSPPEDGDDLGIPNLLDSFNTPRFFPPHIPYHAGRGYERNMRTLWKNESKEAIRATFEMAVVERRKKRKAIRERWNQVTPEWISMLRRREEKRLENMYGWMPSQERHRGAGTKPWWAPKFGDLGWDERANIGAEDIDPISANSSVGSEGGDTRFGREGEEDTRLGQEVHH